MLQHSKTSLEAYRCKGSGVAHNRVPEWANNLGTEQEGPKPHPASGFPLLSKERD